MKYSVGDLLLIKHCEFKPRPRPRHKLCLAPRPRHKLFNSYGIVTEVIKHFDAWEGQSTSDDDNVYAWFSQLDGKEYYFCENEITGEVVE